MIDFSTLSLWMNLAVFAAAAVFVVLLILWLLGVVGVYRIGELVHILLLVGLTLLLLAFVKARETAVRRSINGRPDER